MLRNMPVPDEGICFIDIVYFNNHDETILNNL